MNLRDRQTSTTRVGNTFTNRTVKVKGANKRYVVKTTRDTNTYDGALPVWQSGSTTKTKKVYKNGVLTKTKTRTKSY